MLKREISTLKYIKKHPNVTKATLYQKFPFLENDFMYISHYISISGEEEIMENGLYTGECKSVDSSTYRLNRAGEQYFEDKRHEWLSFILPYGITTLIAVSSVVAQIISAL